MNNILKTFMILTVLVLFLGCRQDEKAQVTVTRIDEDTILKLARPRQIAMMPFVNMTGHVSAGYKAALAILEKLTSSGIAEGIVFNEMLVALKKRGYTWERVPAEENALVIIKDMGVGYLIYGSVEEFVTDEIPRITISIKMMDVKTEKMIFQTSLTRSSPSEWSELYQRGVFRTADELLREAADEFINGIIKKYIDVFVAAGKTLMDKTMVKLDGIENMNGDKYEPVRVHALERKFDILNKETDNNISWYRNTSKLFVQVSQLYSDVRYKNRVDYIRKKQMGELSKKQRK